MAVLVGVAGRLLLQAGGALRPGRTCRGPPVRWPGGALSMSATNSTSGRGDKTVVRIGGVTKEVEVNPRSPELVPVNYLSKDSELSGETLKHLRWMLQKDLLGQDLFLIGRPGPMRRNLVMQYLELTQRELEYVALSRDTTESDLKQRREIRAGTAHYIDQAAVRAASLGRILVLEGIEKAERNVLPVLNNLLENREMHLEDGRLLIPASRYDKLLQEHSREELDAWQLVRVSSDFRVVALGLPVPQYAGNPLDPPLRSRFQARDIRQMSFKAQLEHLESIAGPKNVAVMEKLTRILTLAHTLLTNEAVALGLPDFPVDSLPDLANVLKDAPSIDPAAAVERLYPYRVFLAEDGVRSMEETMTSLGITPRPASDPAAGRIERVRMAEGANLPNRLAEVKVSLGGAQHLLRVRCGSRDVQQEEPRKQQYVPTGYQDSLLAEIMTSFSAGRDVCLIGPRGCGKSVLVEQLARELGYESEHLMLYQDMTARDLLQHRTTLPNGDTVWSPSPLVTAALAGKMVVLDGIHRIHRGTLAVLQRLVHDRELQLFDGTRLLRSDRFEAATKNAMRTEDKSEEDAIKILPIKDSFRIVALAEPPPANAVVSGGAAIGSGSQSSSSSQWLTPEILSMFLFHAMRPLDKVEEMSVLARLIRNEQQNQLLGKSSDLPKAIKDVVEVTHALRTSKDSALTSIATTSLSTRQLIRIARRFEKFPHESAAHAIRKASLSRFLPALPREALENRLGQLSDRSLAGAGIRDGDGTPIIQCRIRDGVLTIGKTSAPLYAPLAKTKIPETLFYDTQQNLATMEAMLQDLLLGEHLLLIGNQGVGKNKLVDRLLNLLNRPREYLQLHRDTTVQSLTLQPTVREGLIVHEDSPLVKAVEAGHVLVIDEADKAPTHVTCVLKTLVESGQMILSDGRRIVPHDHQVQGDGDTKALLRTHPDFRIIVLANRPGFPFLGNDFFAALGDLFSCHAIDNPSRAAEMEMLRQYGPDVPEETLSRLVKAFSELRNMADEGEIQYPYSTREVVNVVKHLQRFPEDGIGSVVRNVFDFDSYDKETRDTVNDILRKHGM